MRALLTCLCLTLCMPAMAQDEDEPFDPWGSNDEKDDETASPEDDAKEDDAKEEDAKEEDVEEPALQPEETAAEKADITEETTGPSDGNTTESDSTDSNLEEPPKAPVEKEDSNQSGKKARKKKTPPEEYRGGHIASGFRIVDHASGTGISIRHSSVIGRDGGTNATIVRTRYQHDKLSFAVGLPVASHRLPGLRPDNSLNRSMGLGNLQLDASYSITTDKVQSIFALEMHVNVGSRSYTWVHDSDELWPGNGVDLVWQGYAGKRVTKMYRASLGIHSARGYTPFPEFYTRFSLAFGLDWAINDRLGLVTETSLTYWDTSPWDITALTRFDVLPALRFRAGLIWPVATWAGLVPGSDGAGLRETTIAMDLGYAF